MLKLFVPKYEIKFFGMQLFMIETMKDELIILWRKSKLKTRKKRTISVLDYEGLAQLLNTNLMSNSFK